MTTHDNSDRPPYRVVDARGTGWNATGGGGGYITMGEYDGLTWEQLQERGPLRVVGSAAPDDSERLRAALVGAGPKLMVTVLAGLWATGVACQKEYGTYEAVVAGRPGSWEAADVLSLLSWAADNIEPGGGSERVDPAALAVLTEILVRWTTGPTVVEVSEGLNSDVAAAIKQLGGWENATDAALRADPIADTAEHWLSGYLMEW